MNSNTLSLEIVNSVAIVKFNRPNTLNALTQALLEEFEALLDRILEPGSNVRCLLLTSDGRAFSSGADLSAGGIEGQGKRDTGLLLETHFNPLLERLMDLPIPFVTAVNGPAAGAGCSLAIAGDIVIAAKSAYFLQAFINIGLVPDVGSTWLLPRLIGKARAQAMMMLGEKIPAETAERWGMVYKVVEDDALMVEAMAIASKLAHGPTQSLTLIRRMTKASFENNLTAQLRLERISQKTAGETTDHIEGVAAFLTKRPAAFTGQ